MLISKFDTTGIEKEIAEFEAKYNFVFPNDYKKFLVKYNGGKTPESDFRINKINSDIEGFFGFGKAEYLFNYALFEKTGRLLEYLENGVIPIANNCFNDLIMIGVNADNNGYIYFYYHDRPKKFIEIANNFNNFTSKCKSQKLKKPRSIEERRISMISKGIGSNIDDELIAIWQAEIDEYTNVYQDELILG